MECVVQGIIETPVNLKSAKLLLVILLFLIQDMIHVVYDDLAILLYRTVLYLIIVQASKTWSEEFYRVLLKNYNISLLVTQDLLLPCLKRYYKNSLMLAA